MISSQSTFVTSELPHYGISLKQTRLFGEKAQPDQIEYLDLIEPQGPLADTLVKPDGVVENLNRPLLYFINASRLAATDKERYEQVARLRRAIACRGDRSYLAVIRPGKLDVFQVDINELPQNLKPFELAKNQGDAATFFTRLALGTFEDLPTAANDYLFKEIFKLVDQAATCLANLKLKRSDVISLVGRVLFFRFLRDRGIIKDAHLKKIAPHASSLAECFENAQNTASTSAWLDETFNGDFLPLTDEGSFDFFQDKGKISGQKIFHHLTALLFGEEATNGVNYQKRLRLEGNPLDWGHLDYAHIPVGLLSQVYEKLSWKWNAEKSKKNSVHYTPRNIASTLVGEAFDNLNQAHAAKVLDPACGASVFLVLAFRRLYHELWKYNGTRPNTAAIRSILENQIVGFDVCDSALKLSALSLYLTAIELDPEPTPPEKLKFKALCKGKSAILFDWRKEEDTEKCPVVGSIGEHVGTRFHGQFDLILCNPPWTNIGKEYAHVSAEVDRISKAIVSELDPALGKKYKNPDSVPDLPFIWRSMQWCKPRGRIAMALPARTLFKQGPMAEITRKTLFSLLEVNGIINCSNLRKTKVWPEMNQPFMLFFARNQRPKPNHQLHFISPHTDLHANSLGEMRIDSKSAQLVEIEQTFKEPWLWKALAVGTALDVEVVRKMRSDGWKTLNSYWVETLRLNSASGYSIKNSSSSNGESIQQDCRIMQVLKNLRADKKLRFSVDAKSLDPFNLDKVGRSRIDTTEGCADPLKVYRGPLVLVKEYQSKNRKNGRALICDEDVAYSESFHGYSAHGFDNSEILVRYMQLFAHNTIWIFHALTTSSKFGFERPTVDKMDIDECPFYPFDKLDENQVFRVKELSERLINADESVFPEIDTFFGKLYGLNESDMEVIKDTLEVREPNDELGKRASTPPTKPECAVYLKKLESYLRPFFKVLGKQSEIKFWDSSDNKEQSPFIVFTISSKGHDMIQPFELLYSQMIPLANEMGATQIINEVEGGLVIAVLRQYRYWTPSRARLLGADILRDYMTVFEK